MLFESFRMFLDSGLLNPIVALVLTFGAIRLAYQVLVGGMNHD